MKDAVWIKRAWRDAVWSMLHNIRIRITTDAGRPSVTCFGAGKAAGINIILPAKSDEEAELDAYGGPFAVTYNAKTRQLDVKAGWALCNGTFVPAAAAEGIEPESGILCVCSSRDDKGVWSAPEIKFAPPAADAHPIAEVKVSGAAVTVTQFPVAVAHIMTVKKCTIAEL